MFAMILQINIYIYVQIYREHEKKILKSKDFKDILSGIPLFQAAIL